MTSPEFNEHLVKVSTNRTRGMIEALADIGEGLQVDIIDDDAAGGHEMLIDVIDDLLAQLENRSHTRYTNLLDNEGKFTGYHSTLELMRHAAMLTGHG